MSNCAVSHGATRGGQFGYNWPLVPNANATGPRIEDLSNSLVSGPNLHRQQNRRRNQVLGSIGYFKDDLAGSHDLKFGGEVFHEIFFEEFFPTSYGNQSISYTRNGLPSEVELFDPGAIQGTLMTYSFFANDTWRINNRLTLTPGLRFDRFANSLPEQSHPAGRFSGRAVSGFMDLYNISNSNAEFRRIYISGTSFGFPTTIVPPRIVRFGVKVDW